MDIFNIDQLHDTIFFNIQSVTEYGDTKDFETAEPDKFQTWLRMAEKRYKEEFAEIAADGNKYRRIINELYLEKACFLPEFSKIVQITYATHFRGEQKRSIRKIEGESEIELIKEFCAMLQIAHSTKHEAKEKPFTLCGHNIIGHDIPLLVKRIIKHREDLKSDGNLHIIPKLIKNYLNAKPWDSYVLDTINTWKFNGSDFISLNLVSDFMKLPKTVRLMSKDEINKLYWSGIEDDKGSTLKQIETQSLNFTNVAYLLLKEMRDL